MCRNKGILFVAIDQNQPLSDQGPFDIVLHKVCEFFVCNLIFPPLLFKNDRTKASTNTLFVESNIHAWILLAFCICTIHDLINVGTNLTLFLFSFLSQLQLSGKEWRRIIEVGSFRCYHFTLSKQLVDVWDWLLLKLCAWHINYCASLYE